MRVREIDQQPIITQRVKKVHFNKKMALKKGLLQSQGSWPIPRAQVPCKACSKWPRPGALAQNSNVSRKYPNCKSLSDPIKRQTSDIFQPAVCYTLLNILPSSLRLIPIFTGRPWGQVYFVFVSSNFSKRSRHSSLLRGSPALMALRQARKEIVLKLFSSTSLGGLSCPRSSITSVIRETIS